MSDRGWQRIWSLFEEAVALGEGERDAFLDRACGEDGATRQAVDELLAADREVDALIDEPLVEALPDTASDGTEATDRSAALPAEEIGPYRLLRRIGQGGMSTVFLAVRSDDAFQRRVVLKLVRRGMETESVLRRLRTERQILAGLDHPNIARLFDGGSTAEGLPYFVMEYIEGVPIDRHADDSRLTVDERLALFRKVSDAVGYAHRNLVVHRDVKPSNILVTPEGEPKLLDFGIAKLLNPELASPELEPTATWQRVMTPSYASPEQIRGQTITTASDVYSLGVLLYKLLTGRLPHQLADRSPREAERILTEEEPSRPSLAVAEPAVGGGDTGTAPTSVAARRRTDPRALRRRLAGDLDAIVLKALRSTPRERYGSVEALEADLGRYQRGLPVRARRGGWRYRAAKLVRRHRTAVAVAGAVAGLLVLFAAWTLRQNARLAAERDQARLERDQRDAVTSLLLEIHTAADPYVVPGEQLTAREALVWGTGLLTPRLEGQPEVLAALLHASGSLLSALGHATAALPQLEQALAIRKRLHGVSHPDVAKTMVALASAHKQLEDEESLERAEELATEAVAMTELRVGADHPDMLEPLTELVSVYCYSAEHLTAVPYADRVVSLLAQVPESSPKRIAALEWAAVVKSAVGDYQSAIVLNRKAVTLHRATYGEMHPGQVAVLNNLALALRRSREFTSAERTFDEAVNVLEENFPDGHPSIFILIENIAGSLYGRGDHAGAVARYDQAQAIARETWGEGHYNDLRVVLRRALPRIELGEAAAVERDVRRALARLRSGGIKDDHWLLAEGDSLIGLSLLVRGRLDDAEPLLVRGFLALVERARHRYQVDALERLRRLFNARGEPDRLAEYAAMIRTPS